MNHNWNTMDSNSGEKKNQREKLTLIPFLAATVLGADILGCSILFLLIALGLLVSFLIIGWIFVSMP